MDIYNKLKPPPLTSESDICRCEGSPPFVLQSALSYNPISCADCNLEVAFEKLHIDRALVEQIANWRTFHDCFYNLWLDGGEFENWGRQELSSPKSAVNKRGLILKNEIKLTNHECFYWWFVDNSIGNYIPFTECPNCSGELQRRENKFNVETNLCKNCGIIIAK